ncbi:GRASP55/65 PDZ-like domain-containing protein [Lentinula aciculospora]|uniref:GRASP55/65 PDZ-like domain-containing protein n=1 Tax=Lentinula aciculospora TaxID=153920 RepID=A0A9W9AGV9_9AGAR|nr:GRASP55/65 PDZ-like domain-containing protein [Lentinula aciculospora]
MGASQSTSEAHSPSQALHVLRLTPSSPASQTNIEPFFDFIVGFEGDSLSSQSSIDVNELETIVERHEGRVLKLLVWSNKTQDTRVVPIVPSRGWSQLSPELQNDSNAQPSLLGLSMRMCTPEHANNVWHVLDVLEGSPAESAGLVPYGDYIIGWSGGVLSAENDFYDLVEAHIDKPLRIYVYSHDFNALREVVLVPNRHWGGEGLLGCVFGFGLLHRIPSPNPDHVPGSTPPELAEEDDYHEEQLFVPADMHTESGLHRIAEWRDQENSNRETIPSLSAKPSSSTEYYESWSEMSGPETAVPGSSTPDRYQLDEEDEGYPSQETPRRSSPLSHASPPGFNRASSSLNSTFMNGD